MRWVRKLTRRSTSNDQAADLDPLTLAAAKLVGYMSLTAGDCAEAVLDNWPILAGKPAGPTVSYFVYSQFLFLYLHIMDRMAFAKGGDEVRCEVRDVVTPQLLPALSGYLNGRHRPSKRVSSNELASNVSDNFFDMLDQAQSSFSLLSDYRSMVEEVTERINQAWEIVDLEGLGKIVRGATLTRGRNLDPLVSEVIQQLESAP